MSNSPDASLPLIKPYSFELRDKLPWDDSPSEFLILSPSGEVICVTIGSAQDAKNLCKLLNQTLAT